MRLSRAQVEHPDGIRLLVQVDLTADSDETVKRAPLNLSFVLDRSGSMSGSKLEQCKQAVRYAVSHLAGSDQASIVLFDDRVDVLVPHGKVTSKDGVYRAIAGVQVRGNTNLSAGWSQGAEFVARETGDGIVSRVLVLTDGQANAGVTAPPELCHMGSEWRRKGVSTTTIGCGAGFNEDLLRGMADAGGGNFHYVETAEEAPTIFARELNTLLRLAAQNLRLHVTAKKPAQFLGCLHDYPTEPAGAGTDLLLGDMCAGDVKRFILEFAVPKGAGSATIARLKLSFQQVLGEVALREVAIPLKLDQDAETIPHDREVWREVLLADTARDMKTAQASADKGDLEGGRKQIADLRTRLETSEFATEPAFREQASQLSNIEKMMVTREQYQTQGRKAVSTASYVSSRSSSIRLGGLFQPEHRKALGAARKVVFVTGPSMGLPDVFAADFEKIPAAKLPLARMPVQWRWVRQKQAELQGATCPALEKLAKFALRWQETGVVTTAVDGMHAAVQPMPVVELLGNLYRGRCKVCGTTEDVPQGDSVPVGGCGHSLVPDVTWPGEAPSSGTLEAAGRLLDGSSAIIVLGPVSEAAEKLVQSHSNGALVMHFGGPTPAWAEGGLATNPLGSLHLLAHETHTIL